MKRLIVAIAIALFGASALSAYAGPDESWRQALQKSHERERAAQAAAQAELAALREKCPGVSPAQK